MDSTATVRIGDVWTSCDPRRDGYQIRVDELRDEYAYCTVIAAVAGRVGGKTGHTVRIAVEQLRPHSRGYQLVRRGVPAELPSARTSVQRARATVRRAAHNAADEAELLAMLGLTDDNMIEAALSTPTPTFTNH